MPVAEKGRREHDITVWSVAGLMSPGGLVLFAAWALQLEDPVRSVAAPYAPYFCVGALAAAALLSWYYDYGRVLFVAAAIGLTLWGLKHTESVGEVSKFAVVFLLPLNFALFAWLRERGLLTLGGLLKTFLIVAQVLGVLTLSERLGGPLDTFLRWGENADGWTWLPLTEQLAFAGAAIFLLVLVFRRRTKVEQGLLWALAAMFVALKTEKNEPLLFYSGAAGLILLFVVLEHGYDIAYRDALTGLPARRAFNESLAHLSANYAIAMCDVDHFKKFNDTYGHDAGDQVLNMVATKLLGVQGGGRVFRYGGEEFALIFRGRSTEEVQQFVEALRETIASTAFVLRKPGRRPEKPTQEPQPAVKESVTITISIGVAGYSKRHSTPELVLDAADAALYTAKDSGRNCVKLAEATPD